MVIVVKPIANETNEIIRPGEKEMYVHRVQVLLASLSRQPWGSLCFRAEPGRL